MKYFLFVVLIAVSGPIFAAAGPSFEDRAYSSAGDAQQSYFVGLYMPSSAAFSEDKESLQAPFFKDQDESLAGRERAPGLAAFWLFGPILIGFAAVVFRYIRA